MVLCIIIWILRMGPPVFAAPADPRLRDDRQGPGERDRPSGPEKITGEEFDYGVIAAKRRENLGKCGMLQFSGRIKTVNYGLCLQKHSIFPPNQFHCPFIFYLHLCLTYSLSFLLIKDFPSSFYR